MDTKVLWAEGQPFTQNPEAGFASEQALQVRAFAANKVRQYISHKGYAGISDDAIIADIQNDGDLLEVAIDGVFKKVKSRIKSPKQYEDFLKDKGGEEQYRAYLNNYFKQQTGLVQFNSENVQASIANKLVEKANKTGIFFENATHFVDEEGVDPATINKKMLEDKEFFSSVYSKSMQDFKTTLAEDHNMGMLDLQDPKTFATMYHVYTKGGSEALTEMINLQDASTSKQEYTRAKYGSLFQEAYDFGEDINVSRVNEEQVDYSLNNFTKQVRSGQIKGDYTQEPGGGSWTDWIEPGQDYMFDEYGDKHEAYIFNLKNKMLRGETEFNYQDLVSTIMNYSSATDQYESGERRKASDDVYKFNYFTAPDEVRLAFDILSASGVSKDIRKYGEGEFGITPNRVQALTQEFNTSYGQRNVIEDSALGAVHGFVDGAFLGLAQFATRLVGMDETSEKIRDWRDTDVTQTGVGSTVETISNLVGFMVSMGMSGTGILKAPSVVAKGFSGLANMSLKGMDKVRYLDDVARGLRSAGQSQTAVRMSQALQSAKSGKTAEQLQKAYNFSEQTLGFSAKYAVGGAARQALGYAAEGDTFYDDTLLGSGLVDMALDNESPEIQDSFRRMGVLNQFLLETASAEFLGAGIALGVKGFSTGLKKLRGVQSADVEQQAKLLRDVAPKTPDQKTEALTKEFLQNMKASIDEVEAGNLAPIKKSIRESITPLLESDEEQVVNTFKQSLDHFDDLESRYISALKEDGVQVDHPKVRIEVRNSINNIKSQITQDIHDMLPDNESRGKLLDQLKSIYADGNEYRVPFNEGGKITYATKNPFKAKQRAYNYGGQARYKPGKDGTPGVWEVYSYGDNAFIHQVLGDLEFDRIELNKKSEFDAWKEMYVESSDLDLEEHLSVFDKYYGTSQADGIVTGITNKGLKITDPSVTSGDVTKIVPWSNLGFNPLTKSPNATQKAVNKSKAVSKTFYQAEDFNNMMATSYEDPFNVVFNNQERKAFLDEQNEMQKLYDVLVRDVVTGQRQLDDEMFNKLSELHEKITVVDAALSNKKISKEAVDSKFNNEYKKILSGNSAKKQRTKTNDVAEAKHELSKNEKALLDIRKEYDEMHAMIGKSFDGKVVDQVAVNTGLEKDVRSMFDIDDKALAANPQISDSELFINTLVNNIKKLGLPDRSSINYSKYLPKLFNAKKTRVNGNFTVRKIQIGKEKVEGKLVSTPNMSYEPNNVYLTASDDLIYINSKIDMSDVNNETVANRIYIDNKTHEWKYNHKVSYLSENATFDFKTNKLKRFKLVETNDKRTYKGDSEIFTGANVKMLPQSYVFKEAADGDILLNIQNPIEQRSLSKFTDGTIRRKDIENEVFMNNGDAIAREDGTYEIFFPQQAYDLNMNPLAEDYFMPISKAEDDAATQITMNQAVNQDDIEMLDPLKEVIETLDRGFAKIDASQTIFTKQAIADGKFEDDLFLQKATKNLLGDTDEDYLMYRVGTTDAAMAVRKNPNGHYQVSLQIGAKKPLVIQRFSTATTYSSVIKKLTDLGVQNPKKVLTSDQFKKLKAFRKDALDYADQNFELKAKAKQQTTVKEKKQFAEEAIEAEFSSVGANAGVTTSKKIPNKKTVKLALPPSKELAQEYLNKNFKISSKAEVDFDELAVDADMMFNDDVIDGMFDASNSADAEQIVLLDRLNEAIEELMPSDDYLNTLAEGDLLKKRNYVEKIMGKIETLLELEKTNLTNVQPQIDEYVETLAGRSGLSVGKVMQHLNDRGYDPKDLMALRNLVDYLELLSNPSETIRSLPPITRTINHKGKYILIDDINITDGTVTYKNLSDFEGFHKKKDIQHYDTDEFWQQEDQISTRQFNFSIEDNQLISTFGQKKQKIKPTNAANAMKQIIANSAVPARIMSWAGELTEENLKTIRTV